MLVYPKGRNTKPPVEKKIAETILGALVIGTTLAAGPIAGTAGFFIAVGAEHLLFRKRDFSRETKRLQKQGYIALTKTDKGLILKILAKGRERYRQMEIAKLKISKPDHWDGKWRLFIFDVPEQYRSARDMMRTKMKDLALYHIQRSVLVYPYDCRSALEQIAEYYELAKYATYVETNFID